MGILGGPAVGGLGGGGLVIGGLGIGCLGVAAGEENTPEAAESKDSPNSGVTSPKKSKKIWDLISCCNLPVGGPVHMNQHLSWLMRNEK